MKGALATLTEVGKTGAADIEQLNRVAEAHGLRGWRSIAVAASDIVNDMKLPVADPSGGGAQPKMTDVMNALPVRVIGVMGMSDSARDDSKQIISELHALGVQVKMLTGDNTKVARAIASDVGLPTAIINLGHEKQRIRALLESGHQSVPLKPGQRRPSGMIKIGGTNPPNNAVAPSVPSISENGKTPAPLTLVANTPLAKKSELHLSAPAIPVPAGGASPEVPLVSLGGGGNQSNQIAPAPIKRTNSKSPTLGPIVANAMSVPPIVTDEMVTEEMRHGLDVVHAAGFAEIFPADKHMIVKALQATGAIVGMTGDGVNDAPALKQAEVGCAVSNATDVAKGSASAVLTHDGLSGIVALVHTGRRIHHRIETWILNKSQRTSTIDTRHPLPCRQELTTHT